MTNSRQNFSTNTNNDKKTSENGNPANKPSCNTNEYFRFFQCIYENTDPEKPMYHSCIDEYKQLRHLRK